MDDFDRLFANLPGRGRPAASALQLEAGRELGEADAQALADGAVGSVVSPLSRLRHSHHELARLIAGGASGVEASAITGKSQSWISTLRKDPAFAELVEYYRVQKDAVYMDVHARLAGLGTDAVNELQHRLDTDPDGLSTREVMDIAELALDRSVAPSKGGGSGGGAVAAASISFQVSFVKGAEEEGEGQGSVQDSEKGFTLDLTPDGKGGYEPA